jgi:hypothetical protein
MYYDNPVQFVFDNKDLRRIILTKYVYSKYKKERDDFIRTLVYDAIIEKWYKFCECQECRANREYYNNLQPPN